MTSTSTETREIIELTRTITVTMFVAVWNDKVIAVEDTRAKCVEVAKKYVEKESKK